MTVNNTMTGSIPTEVGLLFDLTTLDLGKHFISIYLLCFETKSVIDSTRLTFSCGVISFNVLIDMNKLTGSIPTEVSSLNKLEYLYLCKQLFSALLLCFETKQIRYASNFSI